jgi:hypothetical protein
MTTLTQFVPAANTNFTWQPTLDGQQYTAIVSWSLFGQRWILNIVSLRGALVLQKPLRGSPINYDINLIQGYFTTSTLVYRVGTNNFEVTP